MTRGCAPAMVKALTDTSRTLRLGRLEGGANAFAFLRDHYVIYPWLTDGEAIGRVLEIDGQALLVWIMLVDADQIEVACTADVSDEAAHQIADVLSFCLALDEPDPLAAQAREDPIIAAALAASPGLRPKRYPSLWEATCGAICAQNVDFRRLYAMMENLCRAFGAQAGGEHAFPSPAALAHASEAALRVCKVGYRARALQAAGRWWIEHGAALDRQALRDAPLSEAREQLERIPTSVRTAPPSCSPPAADASTSSSSTASRARSCASSTSAARTSGTRNWRPSSPAAGQIARAPSRIC
jgi:3-methyladenine DNA glycosylase/8-oxoguanine DNA glycosylase